MRTVCQRENRSTRELSKAESTGSILLGDFPGDSWTINLFQVITSTEREGEKRDWKAGRSGKERGHYGEGETKVAAEADVCKCSLVGVSVRIYV